MYIKPGKTFNLSKRTKMIMATIANKEDRDQFKNMMIQAQLASEVVVKREPRSDKNAPRGTADYVTNDTGTASTSSED
jgi:hypothetical protein